MPTRGQAVLYTGDRPTAKDLHLSPNKGPVHWWGAWRGIGKKYTDWLSVLQKTNLLTRKLRSKELVSRESQRKKSAWKEEEEEKGTENQLQQQEHVALHVRTGSRGHRRRREGERHAPWRFARNTLETTGAPTVRVDTASDATRFLPHRTFALAGNPAFMTGSDLSFPSTF